MQKNDSTNITTMGGINRKDTRKVLKSRYDRAYFGTFKEISKILAMKAIKYLNSNGRKNGRYPATVVRKRFEEALR